MKRRWVLKEKVPADFTSQFPEYPDVFLQVLHNRGIKDKDSAGSFLNPEFGLKIYDPFLLADMKAGVECVLKAIESREKITVYADYDADAVTAAAIMLRAMHMLGGEADYYIPDRFSEGYGINLQALSEISKRGTKLIITVDCGVTAVDEVELGKKDR